MAATTLLASNRGPVSFFRGDDGSLVAQRGGGGLVSALSALGSRTDTLWVAAALTDADREAVGDRPSGRLDPVDTGGTSVRMLDIDAQTFRRAYSGVSNSTLWFVHHLLYETPSRPVFDATFRREWDSYTAYNTAFAKALAEEATEGARVLVQDYHLTLVPAMLRSLRPDLRIAHFSHTPWAPPDYYRILPAEPAREVLEGILGADSAGFLTRTWAASFLDCCERVLGAEVDSSARVVRYRGRTTSVAVHALGVDPVELRQRASRPDVEARRATLVEQLGGRRAIVRVDRTELSKNIVRGLLAYRELLCTRPEWHERIVHIASAYPSRHDLPEYREYTASVQRLAAEIDDEFGRPGWRPVLLFVDDDYARSLAAFRIADVLLVNPVRDGMNLVAKEGPLLSERGCVLVLSTEAGAAEELGPDALLVNPYDVSGTAEALQAALTLEDADRQARCERLAAASRALPPQAWFAAQLDALA